MKLFNSEHFMLGFNHEFNSLTSPSELAEAYNLLVNAKPTVIPITISILSGYIPSIRKLPLAVNKWFNNIRGVIERESERLIEEKYHDDKNNKLNGNDLLSLLIGINKTLPIDEKLTDDELKYQVILLLFFF